MNSTIQKSPLFEVLILVSLAAENAGSLCKVYADNMVKLQQVFSEQSLRGGCLSHESNVVSKAVGQHPEQKASVLGWFAGFHPKLSLVVLALYLASFPTSSFSLLAVCKNGGGRPGSFYHVNDVSVYLGRQRGGGVSD